MPKKRIKDEPPALPGKPAEPLPADLPVGPECPRCGCRHLFVVYTRPQRDGRIVRRRECRHCGRRITTTEKPLGMDEATQ